MWELARELADVLFAARVESVVPFKTYEALQTALLDGLIDAAWGPPLICARAEAAGGSVVLRGVRDGATTYRSMLLSRVNDQFDFGTVGNGAFRPRVVWVDATSVGGYVLPKSHLRGCGVDPTTMFLSERMLGTYTACFEALISWDADLTAAFCGPRGIEGWGERLRRFRALAYTAESPNDGVVVAPGLDPPRAAELAKNLGTLLAVERSHALLAKAFSVETFDRPPPGTYAPLLPIADSLG
ncbi:MAG: PhnD/SsuA/transferrin family substrate-binding protein [Kofleriaceae bacterium]